MGKVNSEFEIIAQKAMKDSRFLDQLLENLSVKNKDEKKRHLSVQALTLISEENPGILYSKWNFFVRLLDEHAFCKFPAIYIIANLTKIDLSNRFDKIFNKYFNLIKEPAVSIAAHTALNAGKIAKYKPKLRDKITKILLNIDSTYPNPDRVDLVKAYVIEGLSLYIDDVKDKKDIFFFVRDQLNSKSGKTKKIAKQFLKDFNIGK